jgi:hypothetical protein
MAATATADAVKVFMDTDMALDCDDAGALGVLHALADNGEAEIVGIAHNTGTPNGVGAIAAINTYYGRPDIPLGAYKGAHLENFPGPFVDALATEFPTTVGNSSQVPSAVEVYRKVLSEQPDNSVTIVSIGFLLNLYDLMQSPPDATVPLSGIELIARKAKAFAVMGGQYPGGWEFNFAFQGVSSQTKFVVENWPENVPMVFCGFEFGIEVLTGGGMTDKTPRYNPVRESYILYEGAGEDRVSFDLITTFFAVRGLEESPYFTVVSEGSNTIDDTGLLPGTNEWVAVPDLPHHSYLVATDTTAELEREIDDLLEQYPRMPCPGLSAEACQALCPLSPPTVQRNCADDCLERCA